tara:strand:+ start:90145 stop:91278 length:1134 start_codon:yes stop_codon:yes gene_type:complete
MGVMKILAFILFTITFLAGALFPTSYVWGAVDFRDAIYPELATSARALGMGNAYVAKADDASAAFYNPAGLGTVRQAHFHLSNLHLEVNKDWVDLGTGGKITDAFSNFSKGFSVDGTRNLLKDHPGKFSHSRFHFMPNFTARYISFGYLYSTQTRGAYGTQAGAQFEYAKRTDHGPYLGLNLSMFGGVFKIGVTGTYLTRKESYGQSDPNTAIDLQDGDYQKGSALILTAGTKLTLPFYALPTFAIKMNNASSQSFSAASGFGGAPDQIKPSVDVGFSLTPQIGKTTRIHWEFNYKDATGEYDDIGSSRKYALGMELDFRRTIFIRLGYGDGFGSGGIGLKTRKLQFDLTTYAVDLTDSDFRGDEDRRFVLSLSSGF